MICPCQQHSRQHRARETSRRYGRWILSVPFAFATLGFPTNAFNLPHAPKPPQNIVRIATYDQNLHLFGPGTSLRNDRPQDHFRLELARESFFAREVPYGRLIYREARRYGLSPELVAAVVKAESDFRPKLRSEKNALGLMQIIPDTAQELGMQDPFDPDENIRAGTRYLSYLQRRFSGNLTLALAAYNAGETTVRKYGGVPPYGETREYLRRVSRNSSEYRRAIEARFAVDELAAARAD